MDTTLIGGLPNIYRHVDDKSKRAKINKLSGDVVKDIVKSDHKFSNSVFHRIGGVKMANLDAFGKMVGHIRGIINPQVDDNEDDEYFYLDLACGMGGFAEYVAYRRRYARGVGITLGNESVNFGHNFSVFRGINNNGDLMAYPDELISYFRRTYPPFRLVMADGIIDERPSGFIYDEENEYPLTTPPNQDNIVKVIKGLSHPQKYNQHDMNVTETRIALETLDNGGSFILRFQNPLKWEDGWLIYNISTLFEKIMLIRPLTATDAEVYLIALEYQKEFYKNRIPDENVTTNFITWFQDRAIEAIDQQKLKNHHYDRCFIRWGLPSDSIPLPIPSSDEKKALQIFRMWVEKSSNLNELYGFLNKELKTKPWSSELKNGKVETIDHLYKITTRRGTQVTIVKSRIEQYIQKVGWDKLSDVIDWYAPFGFIGFRKLDFPNLIDGLSNPFTRVSEEWSSIYGEEGSLGQWSDVIKRESRFWQIYIPESLSFMSYVNSILEENKNINAILYLPNWNFHAIFQRAKDIKDYHGDFYDYSTGKIYRSNTPYVRITI